MFCFEILSDFGKNHKRGKLEKPGHFGSLSRSVARRGVALRSSVGCLDVARLRCPKGHPSSMPSYADVTTVHKGQNFGFLFRKPRIRTLIV